ncbi:MAG: glycosyltransferase family 2 protein [Brevirhabdus sp.]
MPPPNTALALHPDPLEPLHSFDVGDALVSQGLLAQDTLATARETAARLATPLETILIMDHGVAEHEVLSASARRAGVPLITVHPNQVYRRLLATFEVEKWLQLGCLPLISTGTATLVATWRTDRLAEEWEELAELPSPVQMALCARDALETTALELDRNRLAARAETSVDARESCRTMNPADGTKVASAGLLAGLLLFASAPVAVFTVLFAIATGVAVMNMLLKLWMIALSRHDARAPSEPEPTAELLPTVTILVPLFHETKVAAKLVARLSRLDYPRALLDICLIAEERDFPTRAALDRAELPPHMRVITVPDRPLRTKPRAMNFALNAARGSIVGIYDAEDAPDPDQIRKVVSRFAQAGPEVVCLQGRLDYYNAHTNWLSRCFTVEYASWFRIMLSGFARAGLPVPLGGTTVFMRRDTLEKLGGWDAYNVTEDADLGMRLARRGYRTELIDTVTREEANCRVIPWIKQRSRWLKGYAATYLVHMRDPVRLWRDLGPRGFLGLQVLFLGTLLGFLTAPLLLSFWLVTFGLPHPVEHMLPPSTLRGIWITFLTAELVTIGLGLLALRRTDHKGLSGWVPTLHLYFPLASIAMLKALYELAIAPFYWDKTSHGHFDEAPARKSDGPG